MNHHGQRHAIVRPKIAPLNLTLKNYLSPLEVAKMQEKQINLEKKQMAKLRFDN